MLTDIPRSICVEILSGWCILKWLVHLDTAICNKDSREYLTDLYIVKHFKVSKKFTAAQSVAAMKWLALRGIKLSELQFDGKRISKIELESDTSKVENLSIVKFTKGKLEPQSIVKLVLKCPSLKILKIEEVYCLSLDVLNGIKDEVWNSLSDLRISDCSKLFDGSCVLYLSTKCHNLTKLHLGFASSFARENDFIQIVKANPNLKHLTLFHPSYLGARIVDAVSQYLPNIVHFKSGANRIGPKALLQLIASCPKLRDVDFKSHVRYLLTPDPAVGAMKKSLALCDIHSCGSWVPVTMEALQETEQIYTQITDCSNIFIRFELRDSTLDVIANNNPNLEQLTISYAGRFYTADAIANLVRVCPRLHTLEFASRLITYDDVVTIFEEPNNVTCVSFYEHDELESETLVYIAENVPTIRILCVDMCEQIDDAEFSYLKAMWSSVRGRKIKWEKRLKKLLPVTTLVIGN